MASALEKGRNNQLAATLTVPCRDLEKTRIKIKWNLSSALHRFYLTTLSKLVAMVKEDFRKIELSWKTKGQKNSKWQHKVFQKTKYALMLLNP